MHARGQIVVPLGVTNTGRRAWSPERVHLSYHWLWLVPRELLHRSRRLPYQEGIRSELTAPIAPGARTTVDVRLLAPSMPGVYWLQWDMVEEGVTWFAQVAPPQPRRLVVVLPRLVDLMTPLPLLVALVCLFVYPGFGAADLVWCATSMLAKQFMLFDQALLEPTAVAYWLAVTIALMPSVVLIAAPRRFRALALFAVAAFASVLLLSDIVYYRFFGDVLSAPAVLAIGQTGQVSGSIRSLLTWNLVWLLIDLPVALWWVIRRSRSARADRPIRTPGLWAAGTVAVLAVVGAVLAAPSVLRSAPLDQMFRDRAVMEQLGPLPFHVYDAWNYMHATHLRPPITGRETEDTAAWFAARTPLRSGAGSRWFGQARGSNLIVVQVESLQDFVVDYRVDGQEVMPHLRRWRDDALRFTNVVDQTSEGRTSDAEFVALTSLLPLDHGAAAFRYAGNHYVGLPRVLAEHGYRTVSAVPFEAGFWNRRVMHPSYGFERSLFEPDFTMTEQIGWGLNDRDFLQQMVPVLERLPHPFAAWLITLSLHHPYDGFPDRHKSLRLGALEGTPFGNYLHTMHFFDQALQEFRSTLDGDGLLRDSVLVVFGDHDAGFEHEDALAEQLSIPPTEVGWALADRVPFFIRPPGGAAGEPLPARTLGVPAGQTDFAPTLLALLGIDPALLPYVGRNLLGAPDDPPILRPYGDWLDRAHLLVTHAATDHRQECYAISTRAPAGDAACEPANAAARRARDVSRIVIGDDLQTRLRTMLQHPRIQ